MKNRIYQLCGILFLLFFAQPAAAQPKGEGWIKAGSNPNEYNMGVSTEVRYSGKPSAYIISKQGKMHGFGTYMQMSEPGGFLDKSVRISAYIESNDIKGPSWAGLWFRVDGDSGKTLSFDNMQNRAITGTTKWKKYEIVLDVPKDAKDIAYGVLLAGSGSVHFTDFHFDVLGPTTGNHGSIGLPPQPKNLDFEQ